MNMSLKQTVRKVLNEWYAKIDREKLLGMPYSTMEKIINSLIGRKYDWWKGININEVIYSEMDDKISLYGYLNVDKRWATQQLKKHRSYFKSNDGEGVEIDDITDLKLRIELVNDLTKLFTSTTKYTGAIGVRLTPLHIRFV